MGNRSSRWNEQFEGGSALRCDRYRGSEIRPNLCQCGLQSIYGPAIRRRKGSGRLAKRAAIKSLRSTGQNGWLLCAGLSSSTDRDQRNPELLLGVCSSDAVSLGAYARLLCDRCRGRGVFNRTRYRDFGRDSRGAYPRGSRRALH